MHTSTETGLRQGAQAYRPRSGSSRQCGYQQCLEELLHLPIQIYPVMFQFAVLLFVSCCGTQFCPRVKILGFKSYVCHLWIMGIILSVPLYLWKIELINLPHGDGCKVKWKLLSHVQLFATPWTYRVHGILQPRILEWVAFPFSRGSSQPRDWTQVSSIVGRFFTSWATREVQEYWNG